MTPPRRCSTPYCNGTAQRGGRCANCRAANDRQRKAGTIYNTTRWRTLRRKVLNDEPTCRACGHLATDVDHITPITAGGAPWDLHNLQPLCHSCHSEKTSSERRQAPGRGVAIPADEAQKTVGQ